MNHFKFSFRKKILPLLLIAAMLLTAVSAVAEDSYSVRDAYMYFAQNDAEFVLKVLESGYGTGVTESTILQFMVSLQNNFYYVNRVVRINNDNFEKHFIDVVKTVSNANEYADMQTAIYRAYPDAAKALQRNTIHPSIVPLFNTIKNMVLDHNMLSRLETSVDFTFRVEEVEELDVMTVDQLSTPGKLPDSVYFLSESGLRIKMPVRWTETIDTTYPGSTYVRGLATLPQGYRWPEGFNGEIIQRVNVIPVSAEGSAGSRIKWSLENGVLTVSGSGAIPNYTDSNPCPWAEVSNAVTKLVIDSGITTIGSNAFAGLNNLANKAVILPDSVTTIRSGAFAGSDIEVAVVPKKVTKIENGAFDCQGLTVYGGKTGGVADKFAQSGGAAFVPDSWELPNLVCLDTEETDGGLQIRIRSMNTQPGEARLAFYGSGRELLAFVPITGEYMDIPEGAKYAEAFIWGENMVPVCKSRSLRLAA